MDRRTFLKTTGAVGAGIGLAGLGGSRLLAAELAHGAPNAEKLGWRLGCQMWSFNRYTLFEGIDKTASLGLHYIETGSFQAISKDQPNVKFTEDSPADVRAAVKKKLADSDVKLLSFGVIPLYKDADKNKKMFDFAKDMGIETLVTEPDEDAFETLDRQSEEYGMKIAIHDHPQPSHYWNPDTVLKVCEGRSKRIGACADTGHWARSGLNPVECLKKLEGRIIEFHFKDINKAAHKCLRRALGHRRLRREGNVDRSPPSEGPRALLHRVRAQLGDLLAGDGPMCRVFRQGGGRIGRAELTACTLFPRSARERGIRSETTPSNVAGSFYFLEGPKLLVIGSVALDTLGNGNSRQCPDS